MTPTALRLLATRARTAVTTAAAPHLRRAYNGLTGEIAAWHAAHDAEQAARTDAELEAARVRRHAERIAVAASASGETAHETRAVLGSLLARPEVRAALSPAVLGYYLARYGEVGAVVGDGEVEGVAA